MAEEGRWGHHSHLVGEDTERWGGQMAKRPAWPPILARLRAPACPPDAAQRTGWTTWWTWLSAFSVPVGVWLLAGGFPPSPAHLRNGQRGACASRRPQREGHPLCPPPALSWSPASARSCASGPARVARQRVNAAPGSRLSGGGAGTGLRAHPQRPRGRRSGPRVRAGAGGGEWRAEAGGAPAPKFIQHLRGGKAVLGGRGESPRALQVPLLHPPLPLVPWRVVVGNQRVYSGVEGGHSLGWGARRTGR